MVLSAARRLLMFSRASLLGALAVEVACEVGCVADTSPAETSDEPLTSETFRLDTEPGAEVDPFCDLHTVLRLAPMRDRILRAELREVLRGDCKIAVDPDPRSYALFREHDDCGSVVYAATSTFGGAERRLTLIDHRTRVCKDRVPARIVVDEEGAPIRYSRDPVPNS
jgi:hypothetical protein